MGMLDSGWELVGGGSVGNMRSRSGCRWRLAKGRKQSMENGLANKNSPLLVLED